MVEWEEVPQARRARAERKWRLRVKRGGRASVDGMAVFEDQERAPGVEGVEEVEPDT
jgi:hypothetical protein